MPSSYGWLPDQTNGVTVTMTAAYVSFLVMQLHLKILGKYNTVSQEKSVEVTATET